jgi:hypothetical protein
MALIPVTQDDIELFTVVTTPRRHYVSSSSGVTGSVKVFPRASSNEKETDAPRRVFNDVASDPSALVDASFASSEKLLFDSARGKRELKSPVTAEVNEYLALVDKAVTKPNQVLEVERFTPTTQVTKYTLAKNNVKDLLMPFYRSMYPHADWAYTNYNTLNFFTVSSGSQSVPTSSVLLYPNVNDERVATADGRMSGSYCFSGSFSFDFHVNPRYQVDGLDEGHFKAGTILHLSSCYAVSLITGSRKDGKGLPLGYRLQLQLSHSADIPPSSAAPGTYPQDLVFLSEDNSLTLNNWHHVVIKWGTKTINNGTGSFVVDGVTRGNFVVPSSSITPLTSPVNVEPEFLCVGNFYEGTNKYSIDESQSIFFGPTHAARDGVEQLTTVDTLTHVSHSFNHPLKAELHDVYLKRYHMSSLDISASARIGMGSVDAADYERVAFCLPPFFVEETPVRKFVNGSGGILQTPFFSIDGTTDDPFNVSLAFGVNGHYINLENFTKDFATGRIPRHINLSASIIDYTTQALEANTFLYTGSSGVAKRNLTILPCDDGTFEPNYELLSTETLQNKFTDSTGYQDKSYISLDNLVTPAAGFVTSMGVYDPESESYDNIMSELIGPTPESPGKPPGATYLSYIASVNTALSKSTSEEIPFDRGVQRGNPLTIYQRTLDPSSNQVTFFNISNLYYGTKILPGSFTITDAAISGSEGSVKLTLRDDGFGSLYRADAATKHSTFSTVGNIFYDEGLVVVKNPHLYFFGKNQYEISFKGLKNVYSTKYEILAGQGLLNSSSNLTYNRNKNAMSASADVTDTDPFIYISGMYFHDENMNVIAKAKFAQPIIKRERDKILFKVAFDW